ncbi:MAG: cell wall-binding repeat-containing protein [Lachnospiraceae bacterium]|nr:cell wall-binding repeat-containing protein [Lachnospiraceae bacterium]
MIEKTLLIIVLTLAFSVPVPSAAKAADAENASADAMETVFGDNCLIRSSGKTRYQTSIKNADLLCNAVGEEQFDAIIVSCGEKYPDALAGSYLAAIKKAPIIIVSSNPGDSSLNDASGYIYSKLKNGGTVYILGGTGAVPSSLESIVLFSRPDASVSRLAGADRYETNLKNLKEAGAGTETELIVCNGENYADALSASALGKPILMVNRSAAKLTGSQMKYIAAAGFSDFCILGGTGAVPAAIDDIILSIVPDAKIDRVSGKDRYDTSVRIAERFFSLPDCIALATGEKFPDGLTGGSLAYPIGAPLILTYDSETCNMKIRDYSIKERANRILVFGGEASVPQTSADIIVSRSPLAEWKLSEGSGAAAGCTGTNALPAVIRWGVWLNNATFGKVLDFSTEGSGARIDGFDLSGKESLAVSAWIMAPVREKVERVIASQCGNTSETGFRLFLDENGQLCFSCSGLGDIHGSGVALTDGKWHHVLVSYDEGCVSYYIDRQEAGRFEAAGSAGFSSEAMCIGSDADGRFSFDGSIAQVRIFDCGVLPVQASDTVLIESDNEPASPRMKLSKGIVIDRRQYYGPVPYDWEGQTVRENDIINCRDMGFDHVKILLTPNHLITDDGSLISENMAYITQVIGYVEKIGYRCILCIHPEGDFKSTYLGDTDRFEILLKWYGELAAYIGEHWDADTVALQLMTEPGNNSSAVSWSWMSDRMWGAVRNVLPDHTLLTSSDEYGHIERIKTMSPASDSNLIYTFTTYEPYTIGWYYYNTNHGEMTAWSYVHDIPYPLEDGVDYTSAVEYAISDVPEEMKAGIRKQLMAYVRGEYDGKWTSRVNCYDSLYNAGWHMMRAKSLDDWRQRYGGNIHIMCVEFGCMDSETPKNLWESAAPCFGITDEKRIEFVADLVRSFESYDIGWSYWSYNEAHTVFRTDAHVYGTSPDPENAKNMFDYKLLSEALGVTPLVSDSDSVIIKTDSTDGWFGSQMVSEHSSDSPCGAWLSASERDQNGYIVFANSFARLDLKRYEGGSLHTWIYVEDKTKLAECCLEITSSGAPDDQESAWIILSQITDNGWNELTLPLDSAMLSGGGVDLGGVNYFRLYMNLMGNTKAGIGKIEIKK